MTKDKYYMKKIIILVILLTSSLVIFAEGGESSRRANPNYKKLKVYAHVSQRYGKSNYYQLQIEIVNTGIKSVSFWEDTNTYQYVFMLSAGGITFVNNRERECALKNITYKQKAMLATYRKVTILPHAKYLIKLDICIYNRKVFFKSNKNLRLLFHFEDANLSFCEDPTKPKILSDNIIDYKW